MVRRNDGAINRATGRLGRRASRAPEGREAPQWREAAVAPAAAQAAAGVDQPGGLGLGLFNVDGAHGWQGADITKLAGCHTCRHSLTTCSNEALWMSTAQTTTCSDR